SRAFNSRQRAVTTSDQVELIPDRSLRRSRDILQTTTRESREGIDDTRLTSGARGRFFAARIHEPTTADGREDQRHGECGSNHRRAQIAHGRCHRATRAKGHLLKRAGVRTQRLFGLRAAVNIVKYYPRKPPFGCLTQVFDVDHAWRLN